jgi:hypothetical protein
LICDKRSICHLNRPLPKGYVAQKGGIDAPGRRIRPRPRGFSSDRVDHRCQGTPPRSPHPCKPVSARVLARSRVPSQSTLANCVGWFHRFAVAGMHFRPLLQRTATCGLFASRGSALRVAHVRATRESLPCRRVERSAAAGTMGAYHLRRSRLLVRYNSCQCLAFTCPRPSRRVPSTWFARWPNSTGQ